MVERGCCGSQLGLQMERCPPPREQVEDKDWTGQEGSGCRSPRSWVAVGPPGLVGPPRELCFRWMMPC